jgi:hypothetical protein
MGFSAFVAVVIRFNRFDPGLFVCTKKPHSPRLTT